MTTDSYTRATTMVLVAVTTLGATLAGCGIRSVDVDTLPTELRASYALFESRCSKCHTIARPLNAPIRDATHWELYVARMRRTPGSGISVRDAQQILRFLTYYTTVIRGGEHVEADSSERSRPTHEAPAGSTAASTPVDGPDDAPTPLEGVTFEDEEDSDAPADP